MVKSKRVLIREKLLLEKIKEKDMKKANALKDLMNYAETQGKILELDEAEQIYSSDLNHDLVLHGAILSSKVPKPQIKITKEMILTSIKSIQMGKKRAEKIKKQLKT